MNAAPYFIRLAQRRMSDLDVSLRELCRRASLDPSFFSKVLAGKRSPPSDEAVLRRLAEALEVPAAELIVAAGRVPSEWARRLDDPEVFYSVDAQLRGAAPAPRRVPEPAAPRSNFFPRPAMSEELL